MRNLTVDNCLERFLQLSVCPLKVLVVVAAPKRAVVHQLQGDMHGNTVIFGYNIPIFVYMIENPLSRKTLVPAYYYGSVCAFKGKVAPTGQKECTPCCCHSFG